MELKTSDLIVIVEMGTSFSAILLPSYPRLAPLHTMPLPLHYFYILVLSCTTCFDVLSEFFLRTQMRIEQCYSESSLYLHSSLYLIMQLLRVSRKAKKMDASSLLVPA